jgi:hypothetical protein
MLLAVDAAGLSRLARSCHAWHQLLEICNKPDLVAIDGKTSRRSHDRKRGQKALHLVSAFATTRRLVLGQGATDEKSNEIAAIRALVKRIELKGRPDLD